MAEKLTRGEVIDFLQSEEHIGPKRLDEFRKILRETKESIDEWQNSGEEYSWNSSNCY